MDQLATRPSLQDWPPHGLTNVWDMLRFHADQFVLAMNNIRGLDTLTGEPEWLSDKEQRSFYAAQMDALIGQLNDLNLRVSARKAERIRFLFRGDTTNKAIRAELIKRHSSELLERIEHELEGKAVYYLSDNVELLETSYPFGDEVANAFPSAQYDISEAAKCLALRRYTACVTHLMRSLEVGLSCLASALGKSLQTENWNTILNDVENEIRSRTKATHGEEWKSRDEPYFTEAATHFRLIKNAWRNHAAHAREKYVGEEAEEIYRIVRAFMRHLSERLSEENAEASPPS